MLFGMALGPLAWSIVLLHNALVFHSPDHIANIFIHLSPSLLCWTLLYHHKTIIEKFPGVFGSWIINEWSISKMYQSFSSAYITWWVPYTIWLLLIGLGAPKRGCATVYDGTARDGELAKLANLTVFLMER